ncbi:MAG: MFS transporter [Sphingomicrobium sp.]
MRYPVVFALLFAPFGISSGYVTVTLAFQLAHKGMATAAVATLIALSVWPQTWKMLWAPIVDTIGNPKLWYGIGALIVGASILAMSLLPATPRELPVLGVLIVISSIASTLVSMSAEIFMTHGTPPELRGRASGWSQAGNLGGGGIGGGLGLALVEHVAQPWVSGAALAALCLVCWAGVMFVPRAKRREADLNYVVRIKTVLIDVWQVAKSRLGYLALIIMVLPIASGGVSWSAISGEWGAGADVVALVNGVATGLVAMVGALIGGYVCDRLDPKKAYCLFGLLAGVIAATMAFAPRSPTVFIVFVLAYQMAVGAGYAGYAAVVLEAIGKRSAATNFNLMAALSNIPIAVMTTFDGWTHDRFGTRSMLFGELALPAATIAVFALLVALTRRKRVAVLG